MTSPKKILLFGAGGQVGQMLVRLADARAVALDRAAADITNEAAVAHAVRHYKPDAVVNAAAYTAVDRAETEAVQAFAVNRDGAGYVAAASASAGVPLIYISTDYVFDGAKVTPYREDDPVAPLDVYGASKAEGEEAVRRTCPGHIVLRTSWIYSPYGTNFVRTMLRLAGERPELSIVDDQTGCPTAATDIASAILTILDHVGRPGFAAWGTYHYRGADILTWYGFAERIFALAAERHLKTPRLKPIATKDHPTSAQRPAYSVLSTVRFENTFGVAPRPLGESLAGCLKTLLPPA